jgi:ABC-2 type transport system permease protein
MIFTIALRELRSMFLSPLAWTVLAVTQLILAWSFFTQIDFFFGIQPQLATMPNAPGVTDMVVMPTFEIASIILLLSLIHI